MQALAAIYNPLLRHNAEVSGACPLELQAATFPSSGRSIDPDREVIVSHGAYGALSTAFLALVNPDDEVIIIEPAFDCYAPMTIAVNAKPVYIALQPPQVDIRLDSPIYCIQLRSNYSLNSCSNSQYSFPRFPYPFPHYHFATF